ncbi:MAG: NAD(P)/FAD-dependent oxidoreductase [Actinomycetota bacterium]
MTEGLNPEIDELDVDLLIIGAGPVGLYAAYYAGFRGLTTALMDSLTEPGGQVTAMYPEKLIYDVAGFPAIKGQDLVTNLVAQTAPFNPCYLLGHRAQKLTHNADETLTVQSHRTTEVTCKAIIITGGMGTFTPRPLPNAAEFEGKGLQYFVPELTKLAGLDVLIVGGGDSAFDWAMALEPLAHNVTLIHRRDSFRAHEHSVQKVLASSVTVLTSTEVVHLRGDGRVEEAEVINKKTGEHTILKVGAVVAALGFTADLGPLKEWGLELHKRQIAVDTTMATNLPRVFAAGDITDYAGKVKLISVGFGEGATAVNNAATVINPALQLFPGHSSNL